MHGCRRLAAVCLLVVGWAIPARAHEGHDHDKPPPLNLPVAPRVVAVTPDFELVGVASGKERLTIFLHTFATNEPIKGAKLAVTSGEKTAQAEPQGDGVFTVSAPWLTASENLDLVFSLTLADGTQDLLAGQLQLLAAAAPAIGESSASSSSFAGRLAWLRQRPDLLGGIGGGAVLGVLMTLLLTGMRARRRGAPTRQRDDDQPPKLEAANEAHGPSITPRRRGAAVSALVVGLALTLSAGGPTFAADAPAPTLPTVPATMATDLAQRMSDATLFVPKATQHLLSVRTILTAKGAAPAAVELTGTIVPAPGHFGRVQPGRPGRIDAAPTGLAYVGKRVEKGQLLAYVQTYIEAADRATMDSTIAETEARIAKNRTILSRYEARPGAVPQVKVDEVRGELEALTRKRAELVPSAGSKEPILAPISGVVSVANATIGQIVDARDILFEIVNPSEFWIEANGYGQEAPVMKALSAAFAMIGGSRQIPVEFVGRGLALRNQATLYSFKLRGENSDLAIGMPVKVVVQSSTAVDGFILPASAVVRGQTGLPIVWVKTEPERFEPQTVKVEPLDGLSVVVAAGLKEDMRIVTDGVTLLNQVR